MVMRPIFLGFCINRFGIGPSHYISSRSDFGFVFAEIFVIEKLFPDLASRRLFHSSSWGVADSTTRRVGESLTLRLSDSERRLLNVKTPFFGESESRRLPESASQGVANSPTRRVGESLWWVGESLWWVGESLWFFKFIIDLQNFKQLNQPNLAKKKPGMSCTITIDFEKKGQLYENLVDSPTRQVGESFFDYEYLREFEVKIVKARKVL